MQILLRQADQRYIDFYLNKRKGESKFGEKVKFFNSKKDIACQIKESNCEYVLLGIPEDIGVFANLGNRGTRYTWHKFLPYLLNTQHHKFNLGNRLLLMGHLEIPENSYDFIDSKKWHLNEKLEHARSLVSQIDKEVTYYVHMIATAGKKAILVGGGHNNAYGIIKGYALYHNQPINIINFDAHADLRKREGRHSGNGFSYALHEGFLHKYFAFGLHENYIDPNALKLFETSSRLTFSLYEDMMVRKTTSFKKQLQKGLQYVSKQPFGIELDCDTILQYPSSAQTPSGFTAIEARKYVHCLGTQKNVQYLHLCEAILQNSGAHYGKLLAYLITDFMKASSSKKN